MVNKAKINARKAYIYKLIDTEKCAVTGKHFVFIEDLLNSQIIKENPEVLVEDDQKLSNFSPLDVRTITLLACAVKKAAFHTIVAYDFPDDTHELVLHVADAQSNHIAKKTISELSRDKHILTQFNAMDAFRIGYFYGVNINDLNLSTIERLKRL